MSVIVGTFLVRAPSLEQKQTPSEFYQILIFVHYLINIVRMTNKPTDHLGSLAKGLRVLAAFNAGRSRMSIAQAAQATGLDRATTRRCLLTLHAEGYADYDGKFFSLTPRALRLGAGVMASLPLPETVQPWLDQLTEQIGQSCSVAVLDGTEIVYLARASRQRVMSIGLMPGSRLQAHCTSMGRVLLAGLDARAAQSIILQSDLTPRTLHSLTDPTEILARVATAKLDGYTTVDQEIEIGLRSIAVPLINGTGDTVAALNTGMAAYHDRVQDMVRDYLPALQRVQGGLRGLL